MRRLPPLATFLLLSGVAACATTPGLAPGQRFPVFFTNAAVDPDLQGGKVVDAAAAWARRYPDERIEVVGYADPRAPESEQDRLAMHRADRIAALLESRGVAPSRIRRRLGDDAAVASISGVANRRVDIAVGM